MKRFVNFLQILTLTLTFQNLWLPDVEILDLKAFETHSVLSKLEGGKDLLKTHNSVKTEKYEALQKKVFQSPLWQESGLTQIWRSCMRLQPGEFC